MQIRSAFFGVLMLLGTATLVANPPVSDGPGSQYEEIELANGLDVIVIPDRTVPLVTVNLAVRTGGFTESEEYAGLSHLYEHMFFKANAVLPSQEAFMDRVRSLGIVFNGYTSDEVVDYFFTLPKSNLTEGMKFMADAIKTPRFEPHELEKEREVVLGEFDRNEAQPEFVLRYALDSALWMPYVSRKQPLGQRRVIKTATVDKMELIKGRFYLPNNAALIVSGDVDVDQVFELARRYFADWERGPDPFPKYDPPAFPPLQSQLVIREAAVPHTIVRMHWHGPSVLQDEPDPYVADVLFTLLGQPISRFHNVLVDSGIVNNVYIGYQSAQNVGPISIYATVPNGNAERAVEVIKSELRAMTQPGYFTEEDLDIAKQILADSRVFERENIQQFTTRIATFWWSVGGGLDYYTTLDENYQKVTVEQAREFLREYVVGQNFVLGVGASGDQLDDLNLNAEDLKW